MSQIKVVGKYQINNFASAIVWSAAVNLGDNGGAAMFRFWGVQSETDVHIKDQTNV